MQAGPCDVLLPDREQLERGPEDHGCGYDGSRQPPLPAGYG
jgi:hypothetical protein